MTCKDCKQWRVCANKHKSAVYDEDGDSWANWCDDFTPKYKGRTVHHKGLTAVQSGNFHVMIYSESDDKVWCHIPEKKRLSRRGLKKDIKLYLHLLSVPHWGDDEG